ncbi:hypothetical protein [Archaeoglobus sp.]
MQQNLSQAEHGLHLSLARNIYTILIRVGVRKALKKNTFLSFLRNILRHRLEDYLGRYVVLKAKTIDSYF